jgi:hypothetical protein
MGRRAAASRFSEHHAISQPSATALFLFRALGQRRLDDAQAIRWREAVADQRRFGSIVTRLPDRTLHRDLHVGRPGWISRTEAHVNPRGARRVEDREAAGLLFDVRRTASSTSLG